jgi:transposase
MDAASLPDDIATLRAALTETQARACAAEALITSLKLEIAKLRRELYGPRSERTARLLDQLELHWEELEATASEDELAAEHRGREPLR